MKRLAWMWLALDLVLIENLLRRADVFRQYASLRIDNFPVFFSFPLALLSDVALQGIFAATVFLSMLVLWKPRHQGLRIALWFGLTLISAWNLGLQRGGHMFHMLYLIVTLRAWVPVFTAHTWKKTDDRLWLLEYAHLRFLFVALYFLVALSNLKYGWINWKAGVHGFFDWDYLGTQVAAGMMEFNARPALGLWAVRHSSWMWPVQMFYLVIKLLTPLMLWKKNLFLPLLILFWGYHVFIALSFGAIFFEDQILILTVLICYELSRRASRMPSLSLPSHQRR